jgi:hypothetical protein
MIIPLVLAVASTSVVVFLAGYRLAMYHNKMYSLSLFEESESLEPIFARLDREYAYTEELAKPFTDEK